MRRPRGTSRTGAAAATGTVLALLALTACASAPSSRTATAGAPSSSGASPAASSVPPSTSEPGSPSASDSGSPSASTTAVGFGTAEVSGGTPYTGPDQAHLQRIAVGSHTGYDRLVLYFGTDAVPPFTVSPQDTATFPADPSDLAVRLAGTAGVRVVVHDTVRANRTVEALRPLFPAIRQVRDIGDFEAVVSYGVGVQGPARVRVTTLTSPSRLVVDVAWPDPA